MGMWAVDINLGEEIKFHAVAVGESANVLRRAGLLLPKLVAREAQNA